MRRLRRGQQPLQHALSFLLLSWCGMQHRFRSPKDDVEARRPPFGERKRIRSRPVRDQAFDLASEVIGDMAEKRSAIRRGTRCSRVPHADHPFVAIAHTPRQEPLIGREGPPIQGSRSITAHEKGQGCGQVIRRWATAGRTARPIPWPDDPSGPRSVPALTESAVFQDLRRFSTDPCAKNAIRRGKRAVQLLLRNGRELNLAIP